jgi:hydrogenase maturation factor
MPKTAEKLPELGKAPAAFFDRVIYPRLGSDDANIVIGPKHGVDYGVIRVGNAVMVSVADAAPGQEVAGAKPGQKNRDHDRKRPS